MLCHLRDSDRDVYLPRLARFLAEGAFVRGVDMTGWERERRYREPRDPTRSRSGVIRGAAR